MVPDDSFLSNPGVGSCYHLPVPTEQRGRELHLCSVWLRVHVTPACLKKLGETVWVRTGSQLVWIASGEGGEISRIFLPFNKAITHPSVGRNVCAFLFLKFPDKIKISWRFPLAPHHHRPYTYSTVWIIYLNSRLLKGTHLGSWFLPLLVTLRCISLSAHSFAYV